MTESRPSNLDCAPLETGVPACFVFRDAVIQRDQELDEHKRPACTAEEFGGYVWADSKTKEQPVKEEDDGMDAMRYMVADRDLAARPRVRTMGTSR